MSFINFLWYQKDIFVEHDFLFVFGLHCFQVVHGLPISWPGAQRRGFSQGRRQSNRHVRSLFSGGQGSHRMLRQRFFHRHNAGTYLMLSFHGGRVLAADRGIWKSQSALNLRSRSAAAGMGGNTTLVCMTVCTHVEKRLRTLISHLTSDEHRVLAGQRWQTNKETNMFEKRKRYKF